jgi:penicillin-binding protein 1A
VVVTPPEAGYFVDATVREVAQRLGAGALWERGFRIHTHLDLSVQRAAAAAVASGLVDIHARTGAAERVARAGVAPSAAAVSISARPGAFLLGAGQALAEVRGRAVGKDAYTVVVAGHEALLPDAALRSSVPRDEPVERWLAPGDRLPVSRARGEDESLLWVNPELGPQAAVALLDSRSRAVVAVVGGDSSLRRPFNRATQAKRQLGSTFKAFVYGAALESGSATAGSRYVNRRLSFSNGRGGRWSPGNVGGFDGKEYSLREALARSLNSVAVQVTRDTTVDKVIAFAQGLGLSGPMPRDLTLALGSAEASPLELVAAFGAFANEGAYVPAHFATAITDSQGRPAAAVHHPALPAMSATTARAMEDMLIHAVREGTGKGASLAAHPVAGKTGTSNGARDSWFVGWSGPWLAAVWVGYDLPEPVPKAGGGAVAAPLFARVLQAAFGPSELPAERLADSLSDEIVDYELGPAESPPGVAP